MRLALWITAFSLFAGYAWEYTDLLAGSISSLGLFALLGVSLLSMLFIFLSAACVLFHAVFGTMDFLLGGKTDVSGRALKV